jgi:Polyketide cyclase / dehydrase and lipid transport
VSRGLRGPVRIEVEHRFDVSVHDGFDYITEPANWPAYWPRFVHLQPGSRWRTPGDHARITLRMLARDIELEMRLVRLERCRVVEYTSEQRGLPAARHWRHFQAADDGFTYRIVIEYLPRAGWPGLLDRTLVRKAITDTARETIRNLDERFHDQGRTTDATASVARTAGAGTDADDADPAQ